MLPFAGGWLDQPAYIRRDFATLDDVLQWHELQAKKLSMKAKT